jgi:hypothetical protein
MNNDAEKETRDEGVLDLDFSTEERFLNFLDEESNASTTSVDKIANTFPTSLCNYFAFKSMYLTNTFDFALFISATISNYYSSFTNRGKPLILKSDGSFETYEFKSGKLYRDDHGKKIPGWEILVNDDNIIPYLREIEQHNKSLRYNLVGEIARSKKMLRYENSNVSGENLVNFAQYASNIKQNIVFITWDATMDLKLLNIKNKPIILDMHEIGENNGVNFVVELCLCKDDNKKKILDSRRVKSFDNYYRGKLSLFCVHNHLCNKTHGQLNSAESNTGMIFCIFEKLFMDCMQNFEKPACTL